MFLAPTSNPGTQSFCHQILGTSRLFPWTANLHQHPARVWLKKPTPRRHSCLFQNLLLGIRRKLPPKNKNLRFWFNQRWVEHCKNCKKNIASKSEVEINSIHGGPWADHEKIPFRPGTIVYPTCFSSSLVAPVSGSNLQPSEAQGITVPKVLRIPNRKFPFKRIYLYKKVGHNLPPSNAMFFVFFIKSDAFHGEPPRNFTPKLLPLELSRLRAP